MSQSQRIQTLHVLVKKGNYQHTVEIGPVLLEKSQNFANGLGDQDYCSGELKQTSTKNLIAMTFQKYF